MIALTDLTVNFGGVKALDSVSATFTDPVSGIIGPNGAGKTTLMNVISGFLPCTGKISCDGTDIGQLAPFKRARFGLRRSFQREQIGDDMTVRDNLQVICDSLPAGAAKKVQDIDRALELTKLADQADRIAGELNKFERRLTDVARCLVGQPKLIIFDEPGGGLSRVEANHLGDLILQINAYTQAITLVIDHDVDLIQRICSQTLVLDFGRTIAFGKTNNVLQDPAVQKAYLGLEEAAS